MYHSYDICVDIAQKLRNPEFALDLIQTKLIDQGAGEWYRTSLAWGLSGVACFYTAMNQNFAGQGWGQVAHSYLKLSGAFLQPSSYEDISLFSGLAGFCFAAYLCSENGVGYTKLLDQLDHLLKEQIENTFLANAGSYLRAPVSPAFYNLVNGLAGVLIYLIHRKDNMHLARLTWDCVDCLIRILSTPRIIGDKEVLPWYVLPTSTYCIADEQSDYADGGYRIDVPYGIAGVLGALSLAMKKGICLCGQKELVAQLAGCIRECHVIVEGFVTWSEISPLCSPARQADLPLAFVANGWLRGAAGVARCLHLASQALQDPELAEFSQAVLLSWLQRSLQEGPRTDASMYFGRAGLLTLAHRMASDTESPDFFLLAKAHEESIKQHYSPAYPLGFRTLSVDKQGAESWIDNPDLFSGASGIGLALLSANGGPEIPWSQAFVI